MRIAKRILWWIGRFKYVIVVVGGVLLITVLGENSMLQRYRYARQIADLEEEIERQDAICTTPSDWRKWRETPRR